MYKEIKENLISISSSNLSVQNKMVYVNYKGNMNLKINLFEKCFEEIYSPVFARYLSKI